MYVHPHAMGLSFSSEFNKNFNFLNRFSKKVIFYHESLFGGSRGVPCRHVDRHNIVNNHLLQFCEYAQKWFEVTIIPDVTSFVN
jgi:hypothetical protein